VKKISRTISGVTPVAVMAEPIGCPGECIYCPTYPDAPKSYTPESPAVLRAKKCDYEPRRQVEERLRILSDMGHPTDKVELIVMGGTFLACTEEYQYQFIKDCYDGLNGNGDDVYRLVRRGHTVAEVVKATRLLKDYGFKVYYHWMPGLPGSTSEHDLELSQELFSDESFRPDGIKLYPTLIIAGTELEAWYRDNRYQPYPMDEMADLMINIKTLVPEYVRIPRVMRDIPSKFIVAGCKDLALRSALKKRMEQIGVQCNCVRCREYGHRLRDGWRISEPYLKRRDYEASGGKEVFLSFEDEDETVFGLLRMRIGSLAVGDGDLAMVRELHVFGSEVPLGEQQAGAAQHRGLGGELLKEAERLARDEFKVRKIAILSGIGARDYFRSECGYELEGAYMVKELVG